MREIFWRCCAAAAPVHSPCRQASRNLGDLPLMLLLCTFVLLGAGTLTAQQQRKRYVYVRDQSAACTGAASLSSLTRVAVVHGNKLGGNSLLSVQDASQLTADSEADSLEVSKVDGDAPQAEDAEAADASGDGRYPERSPITGGWYGGEIGLQQFIEVLFLPSQKPAVLRAALFVRETLCF